MNDRQKEETFSKFNDQIHFIGRVGMGVLLILFVTAPFAMGMVVGAMPNIPAFLKGIVQVLPVYLISSVVEFLIFAPLLGAGGSYLAFVTGNLTNLKIPCAINARDIVGTKVNTPENEIVSTISIATSALVTTVIVALGVIMMAPLQPLLQNPVLTPAFNNVVPALFGALGYKYFKGNMKIAAIPLILLSALCVFVPSAISSVGFLIIPSGGLAIGIAWFLYKKERK